MSVRRLLSFVLLGGASLGAGALAVVGAFAVHGPGLVGVGLAATLAGCTAAGITREAPSHSRGSAVEAAVWAASWTAGVILVVAGVSTVAGGVVATVVVVAAVLAAAVLLWARGKRTTSAGTGDRGRPSSGDVLRLPVDPQPPSPTGLAPLVRHTPVIVDAHEEVGSSLRRPRRGRSTAGTAPVPGGAPCRCRPRWPRLTAQERRVRGPRTASHRAGRSSSASTAPRSDSARSGGQPRRPPAATRR